jgi:Holliday junction resolvasome RuvABC endonuclease subunit
MYLLSIDPGFRFCGMSVWQADGKFGSSWRVQGIPQLTRTFKQHLSTNRMFWVSYWDELLRNFDSVVIEEMPLMRASLQRVLTVKNVSYIETICTIRKIPIHYISAIHVKKITTGNAKASKSQMRRAILNLYPAAMGDRKITDVSFDEADSIAIGHTYFKDKNGNEEEVSTKTQSIT